MELCLRVAKKSSVFLALIYVCTQFQSTSQQAFMPLSDMADLHVSECPAGGKGAQRTVMLNSQCQIKANLAQRSAGEVALQRNCEGGRGIATRSHEESRVPCIFMHRGLTHPFYRTNMTLTENAPLRMWLNPVYGSQERITPGFSPFACVTFVSL